MSSSRISLAVIHQIAPLRVKEEIWSPAGQPLRCHISCPRGRPRCGHGEFAVSAMLQIPLQLGLLHQVGCFLTNTAQSVLSPLTPFTLCSLIPAEIGRWYPRAPIRPCAFRELGYFSFDQNLILWQGSCFSGESLADPQILSFAEMPSF